VNQQMISAAWYEGRWWWRLLYPLLLPLSCLFTFIASRRRVKHQAAAQALAAPVIVVGNIAVGGTGKTPVIIALAQYLQSKGLKPGIISRGYGAQAPFYPYAVSASSDPREVGDEPLLIAQATQCPLVVGPDRLAAAQQLLKEHACDVILSDDGLQHYKLARQFEMCVIDSQRLLGNGRCLPAGPLREPSRRLREVDLVITNGQQSVAPEQLGFKTLAAQKLPAISAMQLQPTTWVNVKNGRQQAVYHEGVLRPTPWGGCAVHAVSGIGNPQRFFSTLDTLGVVSTTQAFDDHHQFCAEDFLLAAGRPVVMTAKDAVKCRDFAADDWWYLSVEAQFDGLFGRELDRFLDNNKACDR